MCVCVQVYVMVDEGVYMNACVCGVLCVRVGMWHVYACVCVCNACVV